MSASPWRRALRQDENPRPACLRSAARAAPRHPRRAVVGFQKAIGCAVPQVLLIVLTTVLAGLACVGTLLASRPVLNLIYLWIITTFEPPVSDTLWLELLFVLLFCGPVLLWIGIAYVLARIFRANDPTGPTSL